VVFSGQPRDGDPCKRHREDRHDSRGDESGVPREDVLTPLLLLALGLDL